MNKTKMDTPELISALADGRLEGEALARGIEAATSDPEGRHAWHAYHLVGDVLRSGELAGGTPPDRFLARLQESLRVEKPAAGAAREPIRVRPVAEAVDLRVSAANDASGRWKLVAGFASVAAVAAIGWNVMGTASPSAGPQLASAPAAVVPASGVVLTGTQQGPMIRDERLDRLMAAHRQLGGATALQNPAGFVRNATFEGPAR